MIENNVYEKIKNVIDFIEENIYENLNLEAVADYSGLSKYHLHKIFKYFTGEKLMDYVRLRKLSNSTNELMLSDLKIIDIANEYNFDYEQSYIRAFKKAFCISPNRYRKEKPSIEIKEKVNLDYVIPVGENSIILKPRIIHKPEFNVIGIPSIIHKSKNSDIAFTNMLGRAFLKRIDEIQHKKNKDIFMALIKPHPEMEDYEIYIPCSEVRYVENIPSEMKCYTLPTNRYASIKHIFIQPPTNITEELETMNDYLFNNWFMDSQYSQIDEYVIEKADISAVHPNYGEYELLIPIKDRDQA